MAPTPVLLPGESQGQGSLVGCCLWGRTESDTTAATEQQQQCPWPLPLRCQQLTPVNSFIEMQFSYHKIDVFEAYRLTDFQYIQSFLTINMIILETSHSYLPTPTLPIRQPLVYFLFMDLPILNISYKQSQTIGGFFSLQCPILSSKYFHRCEHFSSYV